jgi:hypothetical protein
VLSNGAGLTAEQITIIGWLLLSQFLNASVGGAIAYVSGFDPIEDQKGAYGYRLVLSVRGSNDQPDKVDAPIATFAGGNCTLTVQRAGATIYYTTDGTLPRPYVPPPVIPPTRPRNTLRRSRSRAARSCWSPRMFSTPPTSSAATCGNTKRRNTHQLI